MWTSNVFLIVKCVFGISRIIWEARARALCIYSEIITLDETGSVMTIGDVKRSCRIAREFFFGGCNRASGCEGQLVHCRARIRGCIGIDYEAGMCGKWAISWPVRAGALLPKCEIATGGNAMFSLLSYRIVCGHEIRRWKRISLNWNVILLTCWCAKISTKSDRIGFFIESVSNFLEYFRRLCWRVR